VNPAEIDALVAQAQAGKLATPGPGAADPITEAPSFTDFGQISGGGGTETPLSLLLDLTLPVSIELGRTSMTVQEVLRLGRGSVVQLERLAGEPIDIYVGDRRFAEGEVVVLGEHFGVRVTRILNPGAAVASVA
jgi:flagellar motor switch protein FliN/FliY